MHRFFCVYRYHITGFSSVAWPTYGDLVSSPGAFMFACAAASPNPPEPASVVVDAAAASSEGARGDGIGAHLPSPPLLTKFDPLPNAMPGIYCFSRYGTAFANMNNRNRGCIGGMYREVFHYPDTPMLDLHFGSTSCFDLSSIVPGSRRYKVEEIEVFTVE